MLAELGPPPAALSAWLESLAWLAGLAVLLLTLWRMINREKPAPREITGQPIGVTHAGPAVKVKQEDEFATAVAVKELKGEIKHEIEKLDAERRSSTAKLHEKIEAKADGINARIDLIPERIINILRHTGVIK